MVKGLIYELTTEQFRFELQEQTKFHEQKVQAYKEEEKNELARRMTTGEDGARHKMSSYSDPLEDIRSKIREHNFRAASLMFRMKYIIPKEVYQLTDDELVKLGFIRNH